MTRATAFAELGLPDAATEREVRAAWRRLASQWHPDRNPSAEAMVRMQRINRAFGAIRDAGFTHPVDWKPFVDPAEPARPQPEAPPQAEKQAPSRRPISRRVRLTLEEAAAGCIKTLHGRTTLVCGDCGGSGHHSVPGRCLQCLGSGRKARGHFFGWLGSDSEPCAACAGSGQARRECPACAGSGSRVQAYRVKVRIPPGLRPGEHLHVARERAGATAPPADLDIRIEWQEHPFFHLDADGTLRCEVPVDGFAWIAGREVPAPTLAGPRPLQLQQGRVQYTLAGQGFAARGHQGARPDQVVIVRPVFPETPDARQQALLAQLIASTGARPEPALSAWQRQMAAWARQTAADG